MTERKRDQTAQDTQLPMGAVLNRLAHEFRSRTEAEVAKLGYPLRALGLMIRISLRPGSNQVTCAKDIGMDLSTLGRLVDLLCANGLLERCPVEGDRRAYALHPTSDGLKFVEEGRVLIDNVEARLLANLSPKERRLLHQLLTKAVALEI